MGRNLSREEIPYPICSVVAVFKMLIRILSTLQLSHLGYGIILFCVLAPEGMSAIVFGRDKGKRSERFLLTRKMCALPEAISVRSPIPI
ncbi:MAG: hypothetical protein ACLTS6_06715 [Anaerobutyricum sp.]